MRSSAKILGLILFILITLFFAGNFLLKHWTGVSVGLQIQRVWAGAWQGAEQCERPITPPLYYLNASSALSYPEESLLHRNLIKTRVALYQHFLPADLNSLALSKTILGSGTTSLGYECQVLRDLIEIKQGQMRLSYFRAAELRRPGARLGPALSLLPTEFPTPTANPHFEWVALSKKGLPNTLFVAAKNGKTPVYICQGKLKGNNYPGQLLKNGCRLSYGGWATTVTEYAVLTHKGSSAQWMPSTAVNTKPKAVYGGYENGAPMKICRVSVYGNIHIGKVVADRFCDIAIQDQEVSVGRYEFLAG